MTTPTDSDTERRASWKRVSLWALIVSVSASALVAIVLILWGKFGELEERILVTTLTIAGASLCGLACGAFLESRDRHPLPRAGIALALIAAAMVLIGVWTGADVELWWKWTGTVGILAVASAHLSLLSLARLAPRFRFALPAAWIVILATAGVLIRMIFGVKLPQSWGRALGVAAVLTAAITLVIPVLHRLSRDEASLRTDGEIDAEIARLRARLAELEARKASRG